MGDGLLGDVSAVCCLGVCFVVCVSSVAGFVFECF